MSGVVGLHAVIPVEDTSPGPVTVSRETVLITTQAVLESLPRLWTVTTLQKVVLIRLVDKFIDVTCRHLDHRLQPGRDLHSLYQGDILPALHPWQSSSVAHSDRNRSLWRSLPWHL